MRGPVAQLGARLNGIQEVTGSIPVRSTNLRSLAHVARFCSASYGWQANPLLASISLSVKRAAPGRVHLLRAITHGFAVRSVFRPSRKGAILAAALHMADPPKRFVYLLRRLVSGRPYVGVTSDIAARLAAHNAGRCTHTARYKPWSLVVAISRNSVPTFCAVCKSPPPYTSAPRERRVRVL